MNTTKIIEVLKIYHELKLKYEQDKLWIKLFRLRQNLIKELDSILEEELNKSDLDKLTAKEFEDIVHKAKEKIVGKEK